ncbi:MAG: SCO family protein [Rickettsiales bacterium]
MRKILILLVVTLALLTSANLWYTKGLPPAKQEEESSSGEAVIGGAFTLTNQHGGVVKEEEFRGKLMLVFFGFTHCPDICPIGTTTLSTLMEKLGDKADQLAPVFITVDPARDTPEVLKNYLANFDPRIVGLTGTKEQIKEAADAYKAYYSIAKAQTPMEEGMQHAPAGSDYMVNHSGYIYLMDRNGKYVTHFQYSAAVDELAEALAPHLQ